jgi:hypothetical protein
MAFPPLGHPIDLKIKWADHHRERLVKEIETYRERKPYLIREDFRESNGLPYRVVVAHSPEPLADEVVLRLGDFLNNLRASLDYLVGAMRPDGPNDKSAFPITSKGRKRFREVSRVPLRGIPYPAKELIEKVQPYHRGRPRWKRQQWWPLEALERLWNIDKHRSLLVTTTLLSPEHVWHNRTGEEGSGIGWRVAHGENEAEWWLPLDDRDQNFHPEFGIQISLAKPRGFTGDWLPRIEDWELDALVNAMYSTVYHRVLPQFGKFVKPSE